MHLPKDSIFVNISEIDELKFLINKGVFFIKKVPNELSEICFPTNNPPSQ